MKGFRNTMVPSHTLYSNDILSLCKGDLISINDISNILAIYVHCFGQTCNAAKYLIFAGEMNQFIHKTLADLFGFTMAFTHFIYLGAHIFIGRPKNVHFQFFVDKIRIKLASWKSNIIDMAGKLHLVKVVVHVLMHSLTIYNWSCGIINNIEVWMRNFIWSGDLDKRKVVTIAWHKCCNILRIEAWELDPWEFLMMLQTCLFAGIGCKITIDGQSFLLLESLEGKQSSLIISILLSGMALRINVFCCRKYQMTPEW